MADKYNFYQYAHLSEERRQVYERTKLLKETGESCKSCRFYSLKAAFCNKKKKFLAHYYICPKHEILENTNGNTYEKKPS